MKVTLICLEWPTSAHSGGVSRYAYRLAQGLAELVDLTIITTASGVELAGANMVRVPDPGSRFGRYYVSPLHIRSILASLEGDIVHSFGDDWLAGRSRTPLVRTFFGSSWSEAKSSTGLRRWNHAVLAITEKMSQKRAAARIAIAPESMGLFDCQFLMPPVTAVPIQSDRRPAAVPTVIFIGSYHGRKRGYLVERAVRFASMALGQNVRLQVVGPESDKPNWGADTFHVAGASDSAVQQMISDAWVLMAPSEYEGFGIPSFEALSLGVPVITSSNPGSLYISGLTKDSAAFSVVADDNLLPSSLVERLRLGPQLNSTQESAAERAVVQILESASPHRLIHEIYLPLIGS